MNDNPSMALLGMMYTLLPFFLILIAISIASMWKLFEKAGQPGWAAIVPIYSTYIMLKIGGKPGWWILLMIIPYLGLIWAIWAINRFVKAYGKDVGWTLGVLFLGIIFLPIMAFSKDIQYIGDGNVVHQNYDPNVLDSFGK